MTVKDTRQLTRFLSAHGYSLIPRRHKSGSLIYRHSGISGPLGTVLVPDIVTDKVAMHHIHNISKHLGLSTQKDAKKRNAQAVAERQAAERQRAAAAADQSRAELADLRDERELRLMYLQEERADREALLNGLGKHLSTDEVTDISRRIADKEKELRRWQMLASKAVGNRDRHRS